MRYQDLDHSTRIILKVVGIILAVGFLWVIRDIIITFLLAVVLASAMEPLADYFKVRRIPRSVSVVAVYILVLGIVGLVFSLLIPPLIEQSRLLNDNLPQYTQELRDRVPFLGTLIGEANAGQVGRQLLSAISGGESFVTRTVGVFNGVFAVITVLVISFYLVADERGMKEFIRTLVPPQHQDFTVGLVEKIQKKMGLWVIGQLILSISIFVMTFVGLSLLGIKYALFLALLAGILEVVPYLGPFLSAIPAVFFAFIQRPALAVAVLVLYLIVQKTEGYVLVPKIMQKTVGISPLIILVALLIGFKLAGILGLLLAIPLVGGVTVAIEEFYANQSANAASKVILVDNPPEKA